MNSPVGGSSRIVSDRQSLLLIDELWSSGQIKVDGDIVVGRELPASGVDYYEVPAEYKVQKYRYSVINGHTVLVDPSTRRVVEVID